VNEFNGIYVGLDVHKAMISVAVARAGRGDPEYRGEIENSSKAMRKLLKQLSPDGEVLNICYETGRVGMGFSGSSPRWDTGAKWWRRRSFPAKQQVTAAVARELAGFIWAMACEVTGKAHGSKALA